MANLVDPKCIKCQEYLIAPIFSCKTSGNIPHLTCGKCCVINEQANRFHTCCICQGKLESNYLIEKLILSSKYSCIYEKDGCKFNLRINEKDNHEKNECLYRSFKCSTEMKKFVEEWKCDWIDQFKNFYDHFREKHNENFYKYTSDKNEQKIKLHFFKTSQTCYLFSAHFLLFWLIHHINLDTKKAFWTIQCISSKNKTSKFYYEFEIFKTNDPIRKYKITEYCESHSVDHTSIFKSNKCVALSFDTLITLMEEDTISFRFRVCKITNNKRDNSIHKNDMVKVQTKNLSPNLKTITNLNVGNVIGSSPIAVNSPPLNLPSTSSKSRSKRCC